MNSIRKGNMLWAIVFLTLAVLFAWVTPGNENAGQTLIASGIALLGAIYHLYKWLL